MSSFLNRLVVRLQFNGGRRNKFYKKLHQLLANGVNLDRALYQIETIERRQKNMSMVMAIMEWRRNMDNGINFGVCVAPYVPVGEAMLIEAGSDSGKLERSLKNAQEMVTQQQRIKGAIVSAGAYPLIMILILCGALFMASYNVIPAFAEVLPIEQWQGSSKTVAQASEFIRENGGKAMMGLGGFLFLAFFSLPRWTGKLRVYFDKIVPWNVYRVWQGSSFMLSVASLMSAGVRVDDVSLARISQRVSPYLKQRMNAIGQELAKGSNFGEALDNTGYKFPDQEIIDDLRIYASLKGFENNLVEITKDWVNDAEENVKASMKIINFIALILIAITLGGLISALFGVIQQVQSAAR